MWRWIAMSRFRACVFLYLFSLCLMLCNLEKVGVFSASVFFG
jgi:hypothetical protein